MIEIAQLEMQCGTATKRKAKLCFAQPRPRAHAQQRGAIAIMFVLMLIVMLGFCGMALDLGQIYNRKIEIQALANAVALSAARELNGTSAGVAKALSKAASAAQLLRYQYNGLPFDWSETAIKFSSTSSSGGWLDAGAATFAPGGLLFVKVDTADLNSPIPEVRTIFMSVLSSSQSASGVRASAIAGRSSIDVMPLAVCAQSPNPAVSRANPGTPGNFELVEYGFRRGVAYNLMRLNAGAITAENFVVDPITPPGGAGSSSNTSPAMVGPFACSGTLAMPRVTGGAISVARPFPLASLVNQLNSRFDQYTGELCNPNGAPPDANIRSYVYTGIPWMSTAPGGQTAAESTSGGNLWTVADPLPAPATNTTAMYGPLWSFARAVPYSSYTPGAPEPVAGYTPFSPSSWPILYKPGVPVATGTYPTGTATPYRAIAGSSFLAPSAAHKPGVRNRRVLNVPLLACPVGAGANASATVLAIGRFFMTVPATATSISAEFAGVASEQSLGGQVELIQ